MNARWKLAAAAMLGLATLTACGSKDGTTSTTTTNADGTKTTDTTTTTTNGGTGPSVDSAKTAMGNAATNAKDAAGNAMSNAKDSMNNMVAGAKDKMADMKNQAASTGDHPVAQSNMDKVQQLITDKKYDAANLLLKQVENNKSNLPQSMQDRVTSLRAQLDAAQTTK